MQTYRQTYRKMKKAWKTKWVRTLTSGKYKQTRGKLKSAANGFCCLGVLCDIKNNKRWMDAGYCKWSWGDPMNIGMPPSTLLREAGLSQEAASKLARLNDSGHHNFKKIARWIKENL